MGAGSHQQAKPQGNSMGFIMPLYTIGIVAFFIYTIMKLVCKKTPTPETNQQYQQVKNGKAVYDSKPEDSKNIIKRPDDGTTKLGKLYQLLCFHHPIHLHNLNVIQIN